MISKGESLTVEFKHGSITDISAIYRVMCAFANSKGGHMILGVDDNGTIVGCESKCVDVIKQQANELLEEMRFDDDIKSFLQKVALRTATLADLTPQILEWINSESIADKIGLSIKGV